MWKLIGSRCCCRISSVIMIISSIDIAGNLYNMRIDDRIILCSIGKYFNYIYNNTHF